MFYSRIRFQIHTHTNASVTELGTPCICRNLYVVLPSVACAKKKHSVGNNGVFTRGEATDVPPAVEQEEYHQIANAHSVFDTWSRCFTCVQLWPMSTNATIRGWAVSGGGSPPLSTPYAKATAVPSSIT